MKTLRQLAQNALDVQSACNLIAVVNSFARDMTDLKEHLRNQGNADTERVNTHPMCILYATQISYLVRSGGLTDCESYSAADKWARTQAGTDDIVIP